VRLGAAFVAIAPQDAPEPRFRYVPADTDIHGWSPFVIAHPECFARSDGDAVLAAAKAIAEPT